jgi:hypothetical protein
MVPHARRRSQNKNNAFIRFMVMLTMMGKYAKIVYSLLPEGHTKNDCDRVGAERAARGAFALCHVLFVTGASCFPADLQQVADRGCERLQEPPRPRAEHFCRAVRP